MVVIKSQSQWLNVCANLKQLNSHVYSSYQKLVYPFDHLTREKMTGPAPHSDLQHLHLKYRESVVSKQH